LDSVRGGIINWDVVGHREKHIRRGRLKKKNGAKILVVDDNSVVRDVVSQMLSLLGHEVSSADSGEKGLSIFLVMITEN
jgi:PleD family two-component response regulator